MRQGKSPPLFVPDSGSIRRLSTQAINRTREWVEQNCLICPLNNVEYLTLVQLSGEELNYNRICDYPGKVSNVAGYCWPVLHVIKESEGGIQAQREVETAKAIWEKVRG